MSKKNSNTSNDMNLEFILTLATMALVIANLALTAYSISLNQNVTIKVPAMAEKDVMMLEDDSDLMMR
ncbi:MAG: hypothetical protein ACOZAO_01445 [Patescibacteria group bacterium]